MFKITIIAGARPNFMKIAPIIEALQMYKEEIRFRLVHTGQHYDKNMSSRFFNELGIPKPDVNLDCRGGTQAAQTANVMIRFEQELSKHPADLVLVVGDVNSTLACSLVAKKAGAKVAHVEGGIRSGDKRMPEEINRIATDSITDYFFTTSARANQNLVNSGVRNEQIFFVGNTMIDTLFKQRPHFKKPKIWDEIGLQEQNYLVMTLHRPANVDQEKKLKEMMEEIIRTTAPLPLIFPVHPRTHKILSKLGIQYPRLHKIEPLGYLAFNYLVEKAKAVITDSGGITEETSMMNVPCLTLRDNTERPETLHLGTNLLVGTNPKAIEPAMKKLFSGQWKQHQKIPRWDGQTGKRIARHLQQIGHSNNTNS